MSHLLSMTNKLTQRSGFTGAYNNCYNIPPVRYSGRGKTPVQIRVSKKTFNSIGDVNSHLPMVIDNYIVTSVTPVPGDCLASSYISRAMPTLIISNSAVAVSDSGYSLYISALTDKKMSSKIESRDSNVTSYKINSIDYRDGQFSCSKDVKNLMDKLLEFLGQDVEFCVELFDVYSYTVDKNTHLEFHPDLSYIKNIGLYTCAHI